MRKSSIQVLTIIIALLCWELIARTGLILIDVFPPFSQVVWQACLLLAGRGLVNHIVTSAFEIVMGFVIGGGVGLLVGALLGDNRYLHTLFEPILYYFAAIPKIIIFPILLLFFGSGVSSKIGMAALSAFFPIAVNTSIALLEVKPIHVRVALNLGAKRHQLFSKVYLPAMLGPLLSGMRLGFGVALTGALLGEAIAAKAGMGYKAVQYYSQYRVTEMYAVILIIFIAVFLINVAISFIIQRVTRFQTNEQSRFVF